ncbi:MAG: Alkyl hydroperoxide reductase/ Thiol specific antioxidant/ Mal allergen [Parcubacteria group bacterium GW2011_GWF2_45_11]|nr:MAG: Alkyl hydroperoxide reductase/ Thiol specific antioxidant/ Mal allergen [Parcubacteria group bacterium GW2011_GWF2_45_11]KKU06431.1 MAG: Alkyl hydroperoxide reductase/ Thiol specific antioxidant/ Mal allergen [Parcubacteria group bacterium GW2011_GWA2_45_30]
MSGKIFWFIIAVVIAAGAVYYILSWRDVVEVPISPEDKRMPELILSDYTGKAVNLSEFRGKPRVINVWASWSPYYKKELPDLAALQQEFGGKITVIAVDRRETLEIAKKYSDEYGVTSKIVLLLDPDDTLYQAINGFSMPETLFVDREGFIRYHKRDMMGLEEMRRRVQEIL